MYSKLDLYFYWVLSISKYIKYNNFEEKINEIINKYKNKNIYINLELYYIYLFFTKLIDNSKKNKTIKKNILLNKIVSKKSINSDEFKKKIVLNFEYFYMDYIRLLAIVKNYRILYINDAYVNSNNNSTNLYDYWKDIKEYIYNQEKLINRLNYYKYKQILFYLKKIIYIKIM